MARKKHPDYLLWFDFETDGLWSTRDQPPKLLQMGGFVMPFGDFDSSLSLFDFEWDFGIDQHVVDSMDPYVRKMHTDSGLIDRCLTSVVTPEMASKRLMKFFLIEGIAAGNIGMAGTGIAPFDVPLLRHYMFDVYTYMHYAPYDLGTGRRMLELLGTKFPEDMPDSSGGHTARADMEAALRQAHWLSEDWLANMVDQRHILPTVQYAREPAVECYVLLDVLSDQAQCWVHDITWPVKFNGMVSPVNTLPLDVVCPLRGKPNGRGGVPLRSMP